MPIIGGFGITLLLSLALTVLGLGVAKLVRSIDIEDIGALAGAVIGMIVAGWALSFLWPFILTDTIGVRSDFAVQFGVSFGISFVTNTLGLGAASLVVSGVKVRGFVGLIVAGFVITVAEKSLILIQLARMTFS